MRRLGKRIVLPLSEGLFLVIHLMIAGRLKWSVEPKAKLPGKLGLAAFDFANGTLVLTEAASKKRASIHWRARSTSSGAGASSRSRRPPSSSRRRCAARTIP